MRPFYTIQRIREMREEIRVGGYSVPRGYHRLSDEQCQDVANGIGPGAWSRAGRKMSTWLQPHAEIPAFLHDLEYCRPDKSETSFREANDRFLVNLKHSVRLRMSPWNPLRPVVLGICYLEWMAVRDYGWDAFVVGPVLWELGPEEEGPETELRSGTGESTFVEGMEDSA